MNDDLIIFLYWERDEQAIGETEKKYGRYHDRALFKANYTILN